MPQVPTPYDRQRLHDEVWAEPVQAVAKRYGVSGVALAKACRKLGVPVPRRGYWMKVEFGRAPARPALPVSVPRTPSRLPRGTSVAAGRSESAEPQPDVVAIPARRAVDDGPHYLVQEARAAWAKCHPSRGGLVRPYRRAVADISVSTASIEPALRLADCLYRALEGASFEVTLPLRGERVCRPQIDAAQRGGTNSYDYPAWAPDRPTIACAKGVSIGLAIFETLEHVDVIYRDGQYVRRSNVPPRPRRRGHGSEDWATTHDLPSGRLQLMAYSADALSEWRKDWSERAAGALESQVPTIVRELISAIPTIEEQIRDGRREWKIQQDRWAEEQRKHQIERAVERQRQNATAARTDLLAIIEAWGVSRNIEAFLDQVGQRAASLPEADRGAIEGRLRAARALLGDTDALIRFGAWRSDDDR